MEIEYIYHTPDGDTPALKVLRVESQDSKQFIQFHYCGSSWITGRNGVAISPYLYSWWKSKRDEPIFLVEGEKCAERLKKEGLCSTTTPGGANSWKKDFAHFFKDRSVVILPDNDEPGKKYAEEAANDLSDFTNRIKIVALPGLKEKEDVFDFLNRHSKSDLLRLVDETPKISFTDDSPHISHRYPLEMLPPLAKEYLKYLSCHTDGSHVGGIASLFAALGCLYGNGYVLESGDSLNDYYVIVGKSGVTRKTTLMSFASSLTTRIIERRPDLQGLIGENDTQTQVDAVQAITNFSVEGLEEAAKGRGISMLLCPEEYKSVLSLNQRQSQSNTIPVLTSMYDGNPIRTRLRNKLLVAKDYCTSILAGSTETWLKDMFSSEQVASGFLNRHQFAFCESPTKGNLQRQSLSESQWSSLADLFEPLVPKRTFRIENGFPIFEVHKTVLRFDDAARKMLAEVNDDFQSRMIAASDSEGDIIAREITHAKKLAGHHALLRGLEIIDTNALYFGLTWARTSSDILSELVRTKGLSAFERKLENLIRSIHRNTQDGVMLGQLSKMLGGKQEKRDLALRSLLTRKLIEKIGGKYYPVEP